METPNRLYGDRRVGLAVIEKAKPPEKIYGQTELLEELIKQSMIGAGYGNKSLTNPFLEIIQPGMTVLLKPNWVLHYNQSNHGMECMVTHEKFVLTVLRMVLMAKPARVILGDAPIQNCIWNLLVVPEFVKIVEDMAKEHKVKIQIIDFRRTIIPTGRIKDGVASDLRSLDEYVMFDLGTDSLLEPITVSKSNFRVTCYNPGELDQNHSVGIHKYLLCKEAFESDVIISLPKLKYHRKTGITGALKNLVGLNGNKSFLPHHRVGSAENGGDCYPTPSKLLKLAEHLLDQANRNIGTAKYKFLCHCVTCLLKLRRCGPQESLEGSWYGNDTSWRMVMDLNRAIIYGKTDGTIGNSPLRKIYSLTDAIICGQGNGPLAPEPIYVGAVTFSDCAPIADVVHATLLGADYRKIPLIRESFGCFRWPLVVNNHEPQIGFGTEFLKISDIVNLFSVKAIPPPGWIGHVELF